MTGSTFLGWAIDLLEHIEASQEKKTWCHHYSVHSSNQGQEELSRALPDFMTGAYGNGLVISNYQEALRRWRFEEQSVADADPVWLETRPYLCVLACIFRHFRRDHFCEGSLIAQSIANGKKGLRQRLKQYVNYGWNHAANHKGGRAVWQIEDAEFLLLAYEECVDK